MRKEGAFYQQERFLYLIAIIASVLLSAWINVRESVINVDAICYVLSAEAMGQSGIDAAMHVCPQAKWPFYSILIYGLSSLTSFSYITSAYLLDGFFALLSVVAFIAIIKELGGSRRIMWLSLFVILLSHSFNSVREYIVRDHGFWAFYLVSLLFLLQYCRQLTWHSALGWGLSLLAATLFRIEGAIFLLILPFLVWFMDYPPRKRFSIFMSLYLLPLVMLALITGWVLLHPQQTLDKLGRVHEVLNQFQNGINMMVASFQSTKQALIQHVLSKDSAHDAGLALVLILCVWYLIYVISNLSWIYSALVIYAVSTRAARFTSAALFVLSAYLIINFLITLGFFSQHLFLSKRYLIAFSLILMLWVPFALDRLWQQATHFRSRALFAATVSAVVFSALGGIIGFGYSKAYIHQAGTWVVENVPEKASVYINDYQLMYYSHRHRNDFFETIQGYTHRDSLSRGQWKQYDYIVLRIGKHDDEKTLALLQTIPLVPVKEFMNKRGDKVVIFENH